MRRKAQKVGKYNMFRPTIFFTGAVPDHRVQAYQGECLEM